MDWDREHTSNTASDEDTSGGDEAGNGGGGFRCSKSGVRGEATGSIDGNRGNDAGGSGSSGGIAGGNSQEISNPGMQVSMPLAQDEEPARKIHPLEAQLIVDVQWATRVEHSLSSVSAAAARMHSDPILHYSLSAVDLRS